MEVSSAFFSTAVILLGQLLCCVNSQQIHSIRLTGGSNLYNGEVEVLYCETNFTCAWKTVCLNGWTDAKTEVACKQLGIYDGGYTVNYRWSGSYFDVMDTVDIQCGQITNETLSLNECNVTQCESQFWNLVPSTVITCAVPLEAPTLTMSQISNMSATVIWTIPESRLAIKYYVSCTTGYHTHSHSGSSMTLRGLTPYTNYTCCVSGVDSNNVVGNENCIQFQTPIGVPLAAPTNLRTRELQNQRITLQWDELSASERAGPQNTFSLNVSANSSSDSGCLQQHVSQHHTTDTNISIDNLCPNTLYTISVRACNTPNSVLSCGQYSPTIEIQTVEGAPSIVNNLMCSAVSSTQIRVTWSPPTHRNGVIRHYEMVLQDTNTTQTVTQFINGQTTTGTISHLQPNHHYSCSVAAHTTVRGALTSTATPIKTREDVPSGPPLQLMSFDITRSSFKLNWTEPHFEVQNGNIIGYRIKVRGNSNANRPWEIDTINTQAEIVPVEESTTYIVALAAMTSVGIGPYSEPTVITVPTYMIPTEEGCSALPNKTGFSASTIALSSALAFIFLLFVFFLGLSFYYKVKSSSKRSGSSNTSKRCAAAMSVRDQSQPAIVLESYSALNTFTEEEKKVKPPAVPPKTYLEEDEENEEEESKTSCPSDEDVDRPEYDNCSIGSDSLYDMKLDSIDDMEHSRRSKMTGRTLDVIEANAQPPPSLQKHTLSSKQLPQRKVNAHLVGDYQSPQSHYQKLDTKTMNSFPVYDDINSLRPQRDPINFNNFDTSTKQGSAMPCGQYESLQVKSLNKPSEYQQLTPQKHLS